MFTTYPHSCSYLKDQEATTLFVDPRQTIDQTLYSSLSLIGFRRSGDHVYRPHCAHCSACLPARLPVAQFKSSKSQKRIWKRNADLSVEQTDTITDDAAYSLYARYIESRQSDGDMYPPERDQYESFLNDVWDCTRYYRFYRGGELVAIAVLDVLLDGASAIYTFFDPDENRRSLGVYAILWEIELAKSLGLDYVYLGYWIRECQKMSYKSTYRPLEVYSNNRWAALY